jgi:hypothetical protein
MTPRRQCALAAMVALLAASGCGHDDPRTTPGRNGLVAWAPLKNGLDGQDSLGPVPVSGPARPVHGVVYLDSSFGYSAILIADVDKRLLIGRWSDPVDPASGQSAPATQGQQAGLSQDERNAVVKLANRAWDPHRALRVPPGSTQVQKTVWLIDGDTVKALYGNGAGEALAALLVGLAQTHHVVRDDGEH